MTTRRPQPTEALIRAARALRFARILQGGVRWAALSAGALLALLLIDDVLHLPQALRLPLAVVLAGFIAVEFYRKVLQPALRPFSASHAARLLEMERGIGGNVLINACQFEQDKTHPEWSKYSAPVLDSSRSILQDIPAQSLWLTAPLKKWLLGLALLVTVWTLLSVAFPRYVAIGIERIFLPLADVPPVGNWDITVTPTNHVTLVESDKLDIAVHLKPTTEFHGKLPVPTLTWQEGTGAFESPDATQHAAMLPTGKPDDFAFSFSAVNQAFTFFIRADDSTSASTRVDVLPLPRMKGSVFRIAPPAYTGLKAFAQPGPPATLEVPAESTVTTELELLPDAEKVLWRDGTTATDATYPMTRDDGKWRRDRGANASGSYQILVGLPGNGDLRVLAQGQMTAIPDHPPVVDFLTQDRNLAVNPGATLPVTVRATDDYGVASIMLQIAAGDDPTTTRVLKTWTYLGPPGQKEPAPETFPISLDPATFTPGSTYLLTAQATDFSPGPQKGTSRPIIVRVAGLDEMVVPTGDVLEKLFALLKQTISLQTAANGQTNTLILHFAEAHFANDVAQHGDVMLTAQKQAQDAGNAAITEADAHPESKMYSDRLQALVQGEMGLALGQIGQVSEVKSTVATLEPLQTRQTYILNELISLLGRLATERQDAAAAVAKKTADSIPPITAEEELNKLKDDLKAFGTEQKRIITATKSLQELNPEDLTTAQQEALGELARDEAHQAQFFQNKLTDLSKLPLQDFADGKLVGDMNEVYQEVQKAATALYAKRTEIAVPAEQEGFEKAAEIEQNLERWLPNTPDNTKWSMEEPPAPLDIPMAELPKQLDDLIGDLMQQEQAMDPEKDDVSSSTADSIDKGAGWGAGDGPTSNMSAKGVTGNQLPNNDEINGRSGEGRNGKSNGQMVGDTAVGKGGNETPTRLTPTPFENGSVNDQSKNDKGGATGGGKLAGFGEDGLHGPTPPPSQQKMRVLADQQAKLRQQAESLALQLRKQRRATGDLESAVNGMEQLETAARNQNGLGVVQGYHQALDALQAARAAYAGDRLSRVETDALTRDPRKDMLDTQAEDAPAGYEEMTGAYFRSLSEAPAEATPPTTK